MTRDGGTLMPQPGRNERSSSVLPHGRWKASDLSDKDVIRAVEAVNDENDCWAFTAWVADKFPDAPFEVVAAKLSKLSQRSFVTGCDCGCRGDWEVTQRGRKFAGITTARRPNPMVNDYEAECKAFVEMTGRDWRNA